MSQHNPSGARRRYPIDFWIVQRWTWPFAPQRFGFVLQFEDGSHGETVGRFKTNREAVDAAREALIDGQARYVSDVGRA